MAEKLRSAAHHARAKRLQWERRRTLRKGDIKTWAKLIRGTKSSQSGYSPSWWTDRAGSRKRPFSKRSVLTGAEQEWKPLLCNPTRPWSHPFVTLWSDDRGVPRGSLDLAAISKSVPNTLDMRVGEAALGSPDTGYILIPIHPQDLTFDVHLSTVQAGSWTFGWNHQNQLVASAGEPIHLGLPVLVLNGTRANAVQFSDFQRHLPLSTGCCAIAFRGHPDWGNLTGASSPDEMSTAAKRAKNSQPGLTVWKNAFAPLFPSDIQQAHWSSLDVQRFLPSLTLASASSSKSIWTKK